jgi:hypothetical protein
MSNVPARMAPGIQLETEGPLGSTVNERSIGELVE